MMAVLLENLLNCKCHGQSTLLFRFQMAIKTNMQTTMRAEMQTQAHFIFTFVPNAIVKITLASNFNVQTMLNEFSFDLNAWNH